MASTEQPISLHTNIKKSQLNLAWAQWITALLQLSSSLLYIRGGPFSLCLSAYMIATKYLLLPHWYVILKMLTFRSTILKVTRRPKATRGPGQTQRENRTADDWSGLPGCRNLKIGLNLIFDTNPKSIQWENFETSPTTSGAGFNMRPVDVTVGLL